MSLTESTFLFKNDRCPYQNQYFWWKLMDVLSNINILDEHWMMPSAKSSLLENLSFVCFFQNSLRKGFYTLGPLPICQPATHHSVEEVTHPRSQTYKQHAINQVRWNKCYIAVDGRTPRDYCTTVMVLWYGMVWCGVVRCALVWCGVVWYGVAIETNRVVWCCVVCCAVLRCATAHHTLSLQYIISSYYYADAWIYYGTTIFYYKIRLWY